MWCIIQDLVLVEKKKKQREKAVMKKCQKPVSVFNLKLASIIVSGRVWDMEWGDIKVI